MASGSGPSLFQLEFFLDSLSQLLEIILLCDAFVNSLELKSKLEEVFLEAFSS